MADDNQSMILILGATVRHQFRPEAIAELDVSAAGLFVAREPMDMETAREFSEGNALVLLWPYLRSYIAMTAAAMQIELPPLPVLDASAVLHTIAQETRQKPARGQVPKRTAKRQVE